MKLYDCFIFNGELDLLEIRLNILYEYVDQFVILEGEGTFSGIKKELYLDKHQERFDKFADKIKYLVAPNPESIPCRWSREAYYRNNLIEGLEKAKGNDFIMLSDLDEIPDPDKVYSYLTRINEPFTLQARNHCYYLNCKFIDHPEEYCTVVARKSVVDELYKKWDKSYYGFSDVGLYRLRKIRKEFIQIPLAGWHYSYCMSNSEIQRKIASCSHDVEIINSEENIINCKINLKNINPALKASKLEYYEMTTNNTNKYILENKEKYKEIIYQLNESK